MAKARATESKQPRASVDPSGLGMVPLVELEIPVVDEAQAGYAARHVQVHLSDSEAAALKRVYEGLSRAGATIEGPRGPRQVSSHGDVIRWVLGQI